MADEKHFQLRAGLYADLRDWLKQEFPSLERGLVTTREDLALLEERAVEVGEACRQVETRARECDSSYQSYFAGDWPRIREAIGDEDYGALGEALGILVFAIDHR